MVPVEELHLAPLASLDWCGASLGGKPSPCAVPGFGDDLPADIVLPPFRGLGKHAALLRIEHAGLLAAPAFLKLLDGGDHALADFTCYGAVVLANPGQEI